MRGSGRQRCDNLFQHTFEITEHVIVPKAKHEMAGRFQHLRSRSIGRDTLGVLTAVDLYNQAPVGAEKVHNIVCNRHLTFELPPAQSAIPQPKP